MNTNNLNTALYEKMATEQEKYRDWLKSQPPEEILHHTYEYTVREDIVMAMEELELIHQKMQQYGTENLYCSRQRTIMYSVEVQNGLYDTKRGRRKVGRDTS